MSIRLCYNTLTSVTSPSPTMRLLGSTKFKTQKELQDKIDEYFEYCDNKTKNIHSEKLGDMIVPDPEPYSISGLGYWIGLTRQSLLNYGKKELFGDIITKAKLRIEYDIERRMNDKSTFTPGLIFNAKNNFGWKDEQKVDHTTKGEKLPTPILNGISKKNDI